MLKRITLIIFFIFSSILTANPSLGKRALSLALEGKWNQVHDLLNKKATVNEKDSQQNTLLHHAVQNQKLEIIKKLVQNGAHIDAKDQTGATPLFLAIKQSAVCKAKVEATINQEIIKILLQAKASVDITDNNGLTPLHIAAYQGDKASIILLLQKKANPNIQCIMGRTPLHYAFERILQNFAYFEHFIDIIVLLTQANATMYIADKQGITPQDILVEIMRKHILEFDFESDNMSFSKSVARPVQNAAQKLVTHVPKESKKYSLKDMAGTIPEEIKETIEFFKNESKFKEIGAEMPRGILLVGPPGTGKTSLARAIAGELDANFHAANGSSFIEEYVGVGPKRMRALFDEARANAKNSPCKKAIIFIDEIDAIGGSRTSENCSEYRNTLNELLNQMDGFNCDDSIIIMAATNTPDSLDSALKRPGRFDRIIYLPLPNTESREAILKHYAQKIKYHQDINLKELACQTEGFSAAELKNLINESAIFAVRSNSKIVMKNHILDTLKKLTQRNRK